MQGYSFLFWKEGPRRCVENILSAEGPQRGISQTCHHQVLESLFLQARSRWQQSFWPIRVLSQTLILSDLVSQTRQGRSSSWLGNFQEKDASKQPFQIWPSSQFRASARRLGHEAGWGIKASNSRSVQRPRSQPSSVTWPGRRLHFPALFLIEFIWLFKHCVFSLGHHRMEVDEHNIRPEHKWNLPSQKGGMGSEEGWKV